MSISASQVKELREMSGVGMMECKNALVETDGDIEKAMDLLRANSSLKAEKKASRVAADGEIKVVESKEFSCLIEINSETDFVARDSNFMDLAKSIANKLLENDESEIENQISDEISSVISRLGENIKLRRFKKIINDNGFISSYIHSSVAENLGKIGVIVSIECDNINDKALNLAKQIAMHIAASKPIAVLLLAVVFSLNASLPNAVFKVPVSTVLFGDERVLESKIS